MRTILLISPYWKEEHRWMVSTLKLADLWQRLGFRVVVACLGSKTRVQEMSPMLTVYTQEDYFLKDPWNYGISFRFFGLVRRLVRDEKPDIIVANKVLFWTSIAALLLRLMGKKVTVITDALVGMTWWPRRTLPRVCAALYAWTLGWVILLAANRIVFFHPQPASLLSLLGVKSKSQVIPTGIDAQKYQKANNKSQEGVTVTYVGRLESVKGVDDFLKAAAPLTQKYDHLTVQVVGFFKEGNELVEKYADRVIFTGLRDDIPDILSATDIFVLPSHSEGLSNALMEAMASGCACIASSVGGNRYLVEHGISGYLFPAGESNALRDALIALIESSERRQSFGDAARQRIFQTFDWQVVGERYRAFFEKVS